MDEEEEADPRMKVAVNDGGIRLLAALVLCLQFTMKHRTWPEKISVQFVILLSTGISTFCSAVMIKVKQRPEFFPM